MVCCNPLAWAWHYTALLYIPLGWCWQNFSVLSSHFLLPLSTPPKLSKLPFPPFLASLLHPSSDQGSEDSQQQCGCASACSRLSACSLGAGRRAREAGLSASGHPIGRSGRWCRWRRRRAEWLLWRCCRLADFSAWCRHPSTCTVLLCLAKCQLTIYSTVPKPESPKIKAILSLPVPTSILTISTTISFLMQNCASPSFFKRLFMSKVDSIIQSIHTYRRR